MIQMRLPSEFMEWGMPRALLTRSPIQPELRATALKTTRRVKGLTAGAPPEGDASSILIPCNTSIRLCKYVMLMRLLSGCPHHWFRFPRWLLNV